MVRDIMFLQKEFESKCRRGRERVKSVIGSCIIGRRAQRKFMVGQEGQARCWRSVLLDLESWLKKCWPTLLG